MREIPAHMVKNYFQNAVSFFILTLMWYVVQQVESPFHIHGKRDHRHTSLRLVQRCDR